ncbi:MAG: hypothetical protein IJO15_08835, partial [Clostridia bacterium]|nr:hypothetical protein [Clostridia bacterium]
MLKSIPTALISREDKEKDNDKDKENTMTKKNTMTRTIFSLSPERGRLAAGEKKTVPPWGGWALAGDENRLRRCR